MHDTTYDTSIVASLSQSLDFGVLSSRDEMRSVGSSLQGLFLFASEQLYRNVRILHFVGTFL
jgi:hypothetical protein